MCETTYNPTKPMGEQLEQLLHNISTWRDAVDVIDTQIGNDQMVKRACKSELLKVSSALALARSECVGALRTHEAIGRVQ
jgi:hypothetical protein